MRMMTKKTPTLLSPRIQSRIHRNPKGSLRDRNGLSLKARPQPVAHIPMVLTCHLLHPCGEPLAPEMVTEIKDHRKTLRGGRDHDLLLPHRHQAAAARTRA